ncbi:selenium-dependent molybdenum cofactor biosynthesis protein YqeB [Velocimicrobium porci]|uniref:EF2563 family selenium-dependent molybdenum hydroxylase system protein n=1 Tax=Velocimicrobium porci TaxID=2606634 RepID=A0A6L5XWD1_9FIRM|nr:selenium-dependent molybdenum cofactor biosynthesis protein YqeB [Velocimicrobium porci]MSS62894.1 EF2563 family selenium-dependent molybdenum hydroxylase system protein [Velocimicrobium porci]
MKILIKGAGDLATGIGYRLFRSGYEVIMTEIAVPTAVRRTVSFSRAVYEDEAVVEGVCAKKADNLEQAYDLIRQGVIPVLVDETTEIRKQYCPEVLVDAILAKRNTGTSITDAPLVIGVGPGFVAKMDCHKVIETKRGHYLGSVIEDGAAIPNTGIPGDVGGYTVERIIRASADGIFKPEVEIGDTVEKGQCVAYVNEIPVYAQMSGIVRGMLQNGVAVTKGMKSGDIDARSVKEHCFTISDKARAIGGGVLEAVCQYEHTRLIKN